MGVLSPKNEGLSSHDGAECRMPQGRPERRRGRRREKARGGEAEGRGGEAPGRRKREMERPKAATRPKAADDAHGCVAIEAEGREAEGRHEAEGRPRMMHMIVLPSRPKAGGR